MTPEVTPEVAPEVPCKTDPRAPHGFDRNASHSADRYVCECEGWEPVDKVTCQSDKSIHELVGWTSLISIECIYLHKRTTFY
jgi:hypothetical protein